LLVLGSDFVTSLLAVLLRLLAIFNSLGPVLGEILARRAGAAGIYTRPGTCRGKGRRAGAGYCARRDWTTTSGCGRTLSGSATLEKICSRATGACCASCSDGTGRGTGNVEEVV
jgi:hypothetical protein